MIESEQIDCRVAKSCLKSQRRSVIAHLVNTLSGGGTERHLVSLLRHFDSSKYRHVVVTLRDAGDLADRLPEHVGCRSLRITGRCRSSGIRLANVLRRIGADVLHARNTGTWFDAIVAKALRRNMRLVLGFHGLEFSGAFDRPTRMKCKLAQLLGADFATVSQSGQEQLLQQCGVPLNRVRLLHNGVDLDRFSPDHGESRAISRKTLGIDSAEFVVGIVGSLVPVKRHDVFLESIAKCKNEIPNLKALVVGDGPLRSNLTELAVQLGIEGRVQFCGWREDVPALLGAMDVFLCTSDSEGMSNALLEAMAMGLPIIATDVADHAHFLEAGENGLLASLGSTKEIADHLVYLARSGDARRQLGENARIHARAFDIVQLARNYERFYDELCKSDFGRVGATMPFHGPITQGAVPVTTN